MGYLPWALFAMVTYGLTAVLLKLAFRGISPALGLVVANVAVVAVGLGWMAVVGAGAARGLGANAATAWLALAAVVLSASIMTYYKALSLGPASVVVPIFALSMTIAVVLGFLVLGEPVKPVRVAGIGFAALAILLLTR